MHSHLDGKSEASLDCTRLLSKSIIIFTEYCKTGEIKLESPFSNRMQGGRGQQRSQNQPQPRYAGSSASKMLSSPEANWPANVLELKAVAARTFPGTREECEHTGMPRDTEEVCTHRERALRDSWDPSVKVYRCTMNATPEKVAPQVRRQINKVTMEIWSGLLRSMKLSMLSVLQCG